MASVLFVFVALSDLATQAVLNCSALGGVAMEFNPGDHNVGKRGELAFVRELLAAGKQPFFLMPPGQHADSPGALPGGRTQEENLQSTLALWASQGVTSPPSVSQSHLTPTTTKYARP